MPPPPQRPKPPPKGKRGPMFQVASDEQVISRSRGALLGLCLGEALGVTSEGRNMPCDMFPKLNEVPLDGPRGKGKHDLRMGQTSWATQTAAALAASLKEHNKYDLPHAARMYRKWAAAAFDVPQTVKAVIALLEDGRQPELVGRKVWLETSPRPMDSAALARAVPMGVFFSSPKQREARHLAALEDCAMTHFVPLCQVAQVTIAGVIAAAIRFPKEKLDNAEILKVTETELSAAAATLGRLQPDWVQLVKDGADWLRDDIKAAQADDPMLYGPELSLFTQPSSVRVAVRLAFWELLHAPTPKAALLDVANRGGAACALNAAVTGALFGAVLGEASFPSEWKDIVLTHQPVQGPGPLSGAYHPSTLMTLAGVFPPDPAPPPAPAAGKPGDASAKPAGPPAKK